MQQNQVFPYYRQVSKQLQEAYSFMQTQFEENSVEELCEIRGYVSEAQKQLLRDMNIGRCDIDISLLDNAEKLGLATRKGNFILSNRYQIPVEDYAGNLVSLIGYYPDSRKYITLSTPYFSKDVLFFNFKKAYELSWSKFDGTVILVEGIFDCLSLSAIGLPAMATMGNTVSPIKGEQLKYFKKVLAIPDADRVGRQSLNRNSPKGWQVPCNTTFIKVVGGKLQLEDGTVLTVKDMDNFVSWFEASDVIDSIMQFKNSKEDIEELVI